MKTKKLIETARKCVDNSGKDCAMNGGCPYNNTKELCLDRLLTDLADRIEELHEKSKAKKVDDMVPFANEYIGICPTCGEGANSTMRYCSDCGQKLKWEKVKE